MRHKRHCHATQPLLLEQLREWGIDISAGQIDVLLSGANQASLAEKDQLLVAGLAVSRPRRLVTQIGNDWFACTGGKSRTNFVQPLHAGDITYTLNTHALSYLQEEHLPKAPVQRLQA